MLFSGSGEAKNLLETFDNCFISNTDSLEDIQLKIDEIITNGNYKRISTSNKMKVKKEFIREDLVNNFFKFYKLKIIQGNLVLLPTKHQALVAS